MMICSSNGETNGDFGWLLADVPENFRGHVNHHLSTPEPFKLHVNDSYK